MVFFQLTLAEELRYITTFITPRGCFRFKRTPFGLSDASKAFQKMMEQILFGIDEVQISIDDVIMHAVTMEELINWLHKVFKRCCANNLRLNHRSFLGTCGYLSKFIPHYANIVEPLRKLTRSKVKFSWGKEQKEAKSCPSRKARSESYSIAAKGSSCRPGNPHQGATTLKRQ